jgi:hypothetical protein
MEIDKILLKKEIEYVELYMLVHDKIYYSEEWNGKPYDWNDRESFISTLTMSILACLRCFENDNDKKEYFNRMINEMRKLFINYNYRAINYNKKSFIEYLQVIFDKRIDMKDKENEIRQMIIPISELISIKSDDYYFLQKNINKLFNTHLSWHNQFNEEYINYLTYGLYSFLKTLDENNKNELIKKYLENLLTININDLDSFYDNPTVNTLIYI